MPLDERPDLVAVPEDANRSVERREHAVGVGAGRGEPLGGNSVVHKIRKPLAAASFLMGGSLAALGWTEPALAQQLSDMLCGSASEAIRRQGGFEF
mgnify:CR=1 FL=1